MSGTFRFLIFFLIIINAIFLFGADWSNIFSVTNDDTSDFQPICKFDLNGRPHVVFRSGFSTNGTSEIYYANFNFVKRIWEFSHQPISPSNIWAYNPDIALLNFWNDMNFFDVIPLVVWSRTNTDYTQSTIEYTYFNNDSWTTPKVISSPFKVNLNPKIVVCNAKGTVFLFVVWMSAKSKDEQTDLYYTYTDVKNIGTGFPMGTRINISTPQSDFSPSLTSDSKGDVWLSWQVSDDNLQPPVSVKVAKFDFVSNTWTDMSPEGKYLDIQSYGPDISSYQFSKPDTQPILVVWRKNEDSEKHIYSSIWTKDTNWKSYGRVNPSNMINNTLPSANFIFDKFIGCCWTSLTANSEYDIWYNWCNMDDNKWSDEPPNNISERPNLRDIYPDVSSDGYGNLICVWMGERTTVKDRYDVLSRFYDAEPPRILKVKPKNDETDVNPNSTISMFFIENINKNSVNTNNITVKGEYSGIHKWQSNFHGDESGKLLEVELIMDDKFNLNEKVEVTVKNIEDEYGNVSNEEFTWSFTISSTETFIDDKVYLWPNPSNSDTVNMWMNLYHPATLTFDIYDLSGKKVRSTSLHQEPDTDLSVPIDISFLGSDVYIIIMNAKSDTTGEEKQFVKKLAVVR